MLGVVHARIGTVSNAATLLTVTVTRFMAVPDTLPLTAVPVHPVNVYPVFVGLVSLNVIVLTS